VTGSADHSADAYEISAHLDNAQLNYIDFSNLQFGCCPPFWILMHVYFNYSAALAASGSIMTHITNFIKIEQSTLSYKTRKKTRKDKSFSALITSPSSAPACQILYNRTMHGWVIAILPIAIWALSAILYLTVSKFHYVTFVDRQYTSIPNFNKIGQCKIPRPFSPWDDFCSLEFSEWLYLTVRQTGRSRDWPEN